MSAHPKIQKMCEEESEDTEAVAKLFEINDSINRTIERYKLVKKGDLEAASKIPAGTLGTSGAGVGRGKNDELSLIDLGGPEDSPAPTQAGSSQQPAKTGNALEDDLLGLSMGGGEDYGQGGALSLGGGAANGLTSPPSSSSHPQLSNAQITSMFGMQQPSASPAPPSSSTFGGLPAFSAPATSSTPRPSSTIANAPSTPKPDPFAALGSSKPISRGASPFQFQQSIGKPPAQKQPANANPLDDLLGLGQAVPPQQHQAQAAADDEWTFTSALPTSPSQNTLTIHNSSISISWHVSRSTSTQNQIDITSSVSNLTQSPVSELTFQVAVSKGYSLRMEPQSGRELSAGQREGIRQMIRVAVPGGEGGKVKMRWKVGYVLGGQRREEMGEVGALGVD